MTEKKKFEELPPYERGVLARFKAMKAGAEVCNVCGRFTELVAEDEDDDETEIHHCRNCGPRSEFEIARPGEWRIYSVGVAATLTETYLAKLLSAGEFAGESEPQS